MEDVYRVWVAWKALISPVQPYRSVVCMSLQSSCTITRLIFLVVRKRFTCSGGAWASDRLHRSVWQSPTTMKVCTWGCAAYPGIHAAIQTRVDGSSSPQNVRCVCEYIMQSLSSEPSGASCVPRTRGRRKGSEARELTAEPVHVSCVSTICVAILPARALKKQTQHWARRRCCLRRWRGVRICIKGSIMMSPSDRHMIGFF
jgi:hypothetical protein